jgi:hypothetical protein
MCRNLPGLWLPRRQKWTLATLSASLWLRSSKLTTEVRKTPVDNGKDSARVLVDASLPPARTYPKLSTFARLFMLVSEGGWVLLQSKS